MKDYKIYTVATNTEYDVKDFHDELEKYAGEPPLIPNARAYFGAIKRKAIQRGYKIVWISRGINNNVILDTYVNSDRYELIGFGVIQAKSQNMDKFYAKLNDLKSRVENMTTDETVDAIDNHFYNKYKDGVGSL